MKNTKLLSSIAGAVAALVAPSAHALTVGDVNVMSYADEPLHVQIPISAQGWEWKAMWATAQTYQKGLGLTAVLYKPTGGNTEGYIELKSELPIKEPIVDLQIVFETGHRTTIHRTPILIDIAENKDESQKVEPVVYMAPANTHEHITPDTNTNKIPEIHKSTLNDINVPDIPKPVYEPLPKVLPEIKAEIKKELPHIKSSTYKPAPLYQHASVKASQPLPEKENMNSEIFNSYSDNPNIVRYMVQRGDTVHKIAKMHKPAKMTMDDAMSHIFATNKHAFSGTSYRSLQAGVELKIEWGNDKVQEVEPVKAVKEEIKSVAVPAAPQTSSLPQEKAPSDLLAERIKKLKEELAKLESMK